jgi:hypothetical protein
MSVLHDYVQNISHETTLYKNIYMPRKSHQYLVAPLFSFRKFKFS